MTEHKYTPGPWPIDPIDRHDKDIIISAPGISIDFDDVEKEEALANASLISAAPALLEALISITDQLELTGDTRMHKDGQYIEDARSAIQMALTLPLVGTRR